MQKKSSSKQRTLTQLITLIVIGVFAIITWWNNEKKEQQSSQPKAEQKIAQRSPKEDSVSNQVAETIAVPTSLGNYDTIMANDKFGQNNIPADYYMLALSWSPSFCEDQRRKNGGSVPVHLQLQCNQAATFGWVIHGLWPQNANAQTISEHPRFCQGDLAKLPEELIKKYLPESPGANLLQGQWEKHGACAFPDAETYFATQKTLFRSLNLPGRELSRKELFQWMKQFNPHLRNVRLSASKNELYICYDKQWNAIDCR